MELKQLKVLRHINITIKHLKKWMNFNTNRLLPIKKLN